MKLEVKSGLHEWKIKVELYLQPLIKINSTCTKDYYFKNKMFSSVENISKQLFGIDRGKDFLSEKSAHCLNIWILEGEAYGDVESSPSDEVIREPSPRPAGTGSLCLVTHSHLGFLSKACRKLLISHAMTYTHSETVSEVSGDWICTQQLTHCCKPSLRPSRTGNSCPVIHSHLGGL